MNYIASVRDFFSSPKWGMNMLLGGVALMIPLVGQILLSGWNITQFWAQGDEEDPAKLPEFDFDNFVKYLTRGLWPFLVQLVFGLIVGLVIMVVIIIVAIAVAALAAAIGDAAAFLVPILIIVSILFYVALIIGINLIMVPLSLKATLTQSFNAAFDLAFAKSFISRVWKEIILAALFMFAVGIALMIGFVVTLFIGGYFLIPISVFAWQHLLKQLYQLHLERGGIPVTKSLKLNDVPPALPETT